MISLLHDRRVYVSRTETCVRYIQFHKDRLPTKTWNIRGDGAGFGVGYGEGTLEGYGRGIGTGRGDDYQDILNYSYGLSTGSSGSYCSPARHKVVLVG